MREIIIHQASGYGTVDPVRITIKEGVFARAPLNEATNSAAQRAYQADAETLFGVLRAELPSGTLDALCALLVAHPHLSRELPQPTTYAPFENGI